MSGIVIHVENLSKQDKPGKADKKLLSEDLKRLSHLYDRKEDPNSKRLYTLDLFRGVAALSVMLLHYTYSYRIHYGQFYDSQFDFRYGYLGVQFFFIISGFVIFLTVLKSKSIFDFLYRRITRLYPTFLFCLFATFTLVSVFGLPGREKSLHTAFWNIIMIPGFFGIPSVDGAYWSLVPEVFFYIFMMFVMVSKQVKNILAIGCIFLAFTWVDKYIYKFPLQLGIALNIEWNALFFAGILFYKLKFESLRKNLLIHFLIILSFGTVCQVLNSSIEKIIVASFFILFYLFSYDKLEWVKWKFFIFLGLISYPMYLIHQNVGYLLLNQLKPFLGHYPIVFVAMPVLSIIGISWLIHKFIEVPSLNISRKFKKKQFDF